MVAEVENGKSPGHNIYGSHPIYLMREELSKKYHVVFFLSSLPMDIIVGDKKLTYKTVIFYLFINICKKLFKNLFLDWRNFSF